MTRGCNSERGCSFQGCENPAVDPDHPAPLCETHFSGSTAPQGAEEPDSGDVTPGVQPGKTPLKPAEQRRAFAERLEAAGLDTKRFIDVKDGEKGSAGKHVLREPDAPGLRGNYGVYGGAGAGEDTGRVLIDIDVDDYDGDRMPDWIPDTFTVASPHTDGESAGHLYIAAPADVVDALKDAFGTANVSTSWGGVRLDNYYCVGPGSQLDGCGKDWCDDCDRDDGGYYRIANNVPIATVETDEFVAAVENDRPDRPETSVSDTFEDFDLDDYDPEVTQADDTTDDIRDIFAALERLDARRVGEATIVNAWNPGVSTSEGNRAFYPTWNPSCNGRANIVDENRWLDTGGGGYGNVVTMALIDAGEMRPDNAYPPRGQLWWTGVEHLRDLGFSIPKYESQGHVPAGAEPVAVLPQDDEITHPARGCRLHADTRHIDQGLTLQGVRDRTQAAIADVYGDDKDVLLDALPGMGKTTGAVKAAAETGEPVTYLTNRHDVREKVMKQAGERGLDAYSLPSFPVDCHTASGEHGEEWSTIVLDWYHRGATPQEIHKNAEHELNRPLPCQEHEGQECPYTSKWRFDADDYDILVGHYLHGHNQKVASGRNVVYDEFPADAYQTKFTERMQAFVTVYLQNESGLPFKDYTDLIEHREDAEKRAKALAFFDDRDLEPDSFLVFENDNGHAKAAHAVYTILAGSSNDLGNGWEYAKLPSGGMGLHDRENSDVFLLEPPELEYTRSILALDGTPTKRMWELSLDTHLRHDQILDEDERQEYITDVMNYRFVQTSEHMKPYSGNPDHVNVDDDAALLDGIHDLHDRKPVLISSKKAIDVYDDAGVLSKVRATQHYGNLKSSNEFKTERLGVVIGSQHYGDKYIERWGAYAGKRVEANRNPETGEGYGTDLSYGEFGDDVLTHMRENETLQAAMRFGRDGDGATVYIHTAAFPDWVPLSGEGRVINTVSDGMREVVDAANELDSWRTRDIAAHPDVTITERQVRTHLNDLADRGYVSRRFEGRGYVWEDDGLHEVSDHGEVDLDVVEDETVVAEVSRMSTYTWNFRNQPGESASDTDAGGGEGQPLFPDGGVDPDEDDPPPG